MAALIAHITNRGPSVSEAPTAAHNPTPPTLPPRSVLAHLDHDHVLELQPVHLDHVTPGRLEPDERDVQPRPLREPLRPLRRLQPEPQLLRGRRPVPEPH